MDDTQAEGPRAELIAALTRAAATLGGETFTPSDLQSWARWQIRRTMGDPQNPRPDWTPMPADALPLEDINGMTPGQPGPGDPYGARLCAFGPHLCGYARRAGLPLIAGTLQRWANLRSQLSQGPARYLNRPTPVCEVAPPGRSLALSPPYVLADLLTAEDRLSWRVHWELTARPLNRTDEGWSHPPPSERWMFRDCANQADRWVRQAFRALPHTKGCPLGLFILLDDALREARCCIGPGGQGDEIHAPYLHRIGGEAEALGCVMRAVVVLCYAAAAATRGMSQQSVSRLARAPGAGWLPEPLRVAQDALADPDLCGELDFLSFRAAVSDAVAQLQAEAAERAIAAEAARLPATTIELYPPAKPGGEWRGVLVEEGRDPHEFKARGARLAFLQSLPTTPGDSEAPRKCTARRENLRARAPRLYQAIERYTTYSKGRIHCTAPGLTIREICGGETVP